MAVTRRQVAVTAGSHTFASTPLVGSLLLISAAKYEVGATSFVAPTGFVQVHEEVSGFSSAAAIFARVATGDPLEAASIVVGNAGSPTLTVFAEYEPGAGYAWSPTVLDVAGVQPASTTTTATLPSLDKAAAGVAVAAMSVNGSTTGPSADSGWLLDAASNRNAWYQITTAAGVIGPTTITWTNARRVAIAAASFEATPTSSTVKGTAAGTIAVTGTAAGTVTPGSSTVKGTAAGTIAVTGTAAGTVTPAPPGTVNGTAAGAIAAAGTAAGTVTPATSTVKGTAAGTIAVTGTAAGTVIDPNSGCRIDPDLDPALRLLVEVLYDPGGVARSFGELTYGAGVFGDVDGVGLRWVDITAPSFGVLIRRGGSNGSPIVPVSSLDLDLLDVDATVAPFTTPQDWTQVSVGRMIRVSTYRTDTPGSSHELFVGRIERVRSDHERGARRVSIAAFGLAMDVGTDVVELGPQPAEPASDRLARLLDRDELRDVTVDDVTTIDLELDELPAVAGTVRQLLDVLALGTSWYVDDAPNGDLRVADWPIEPVGPTLDVVDDVEDPTRLASPRIGFVSDTTELLNVAHVSNLAGVTRWDTDPVSVAVYGPRSTAFGWPLTGLSTTAADLDELVSRSARYRRAVNRVESFDVDHRTDVRWLDELPTLDTGRAVTCHRTLPTPAAVDGAVCGIEHRIVPGRWSATVYLTATEPTL